MDAVETIERLRSPRTEKRANVRRLDRLPSHDRLLASLRRLYPHPELAPSLDWLRPVESPERRIDVRSFSRTYRVLRRLRDVVLASTMLVLLSPLLLVVAVLVKLTSPGPIIYRQVRVGLQLRRGGDRRNRVMHIVGDRRRRSRRGIDDRSATLEGRPDDEHGRPFVIYKFRTMRTDAEKAGARFAQKNDCRVTWIGRVLRRTRIDELPQLWNVLRGEMSLVGPRPERPQFVAELVESIPEYRHRLGLVPGLTGVAQVVNGYDSDLDGFRRKALFDLLYLQNASLANDFRILLRTGRVVVTGEGAV